MGYFNRAGTGMVRMRTQKEREYRCFILWTVCEIELILICVYIMALHSNVCLHPWHANMHTCIQACIFVHIGDFACISKSIYV